VEQTANIDNFRSLATFKSFVNSANLTHFVLGLTWFLKLLLLVYVCFVHMYLVYFHVLLCMFMLVQAHVTLMYVSAVIGLVILLSMHTVLICFF